MTMPAIIEMKFLLPANEINDRTITDRINEEVNEQYSGEFTIKYGGVEEIEEKVTEKIIEKCKFIRNIGIEVDVPDSEDEWTDISSGSDSE